MTDNDHKITIEQINADEYRAFKEWQSRQTETAKGEPEDTTTSENTFTADAPEELRLGKPILIGKGSGGTLGEALLEAFGEVFGEEMTEKIAASDEFAELKGLEDQIELASLKERVERQDDEVRTLQAVLSNAFLDITVAKLALSDGRPDDAEAQIDHAAQSLLLARLGKAHFHIHE